MSETPNPASTPPGAEGTPPLDAPAQNPNAAPQTEATPDPNQVRHEELLRVLGSVAAAVTAVGDRVDQNTAAMDYVGQAVQQNSAVTAAVGQAVQQNTQVVGSLAAAFGGRPGATKRNGWGPTAYHKGKDVRAGIVPTVETQDKQGNTVIAKDPDLRQVLTIPYTEYKLPVEDPDNPTPPAPGPQRYNYLPWGPNMAQRGRDMLQDRSNTRTRRTGGALLMLAGAVVAGATIPSPLGPSAVRGSDLNPRPSRARNGLRPDPRIEPKPRPTGRTPIHPDNSYDYLSLDPPAMPGPKQRKPRFLRIRNAGRRAAGMPEIKDPTKKP